MDANLRRGLQTERIDARKDWVRYVELKAAIHRTHAARIEDELAPILEDLLRRNARRAAAR